MLAERGRLQRPALGLRVTSSLRGGGEGLGLKLLRCKEQENAGGGTVEKLATVFSVTNTKDKSTSTEISGAHPSKCFFFFFFKLKTCASLSL